ncbi:MAG: FAD-dependent thymidylate synthase [Oscillospiraceae bacterium]
MNVKLISHTPNPEKIIACAAKLCYASTSIDELFDGLTPEKTESFVKMLSTIGHESPIEHCSFTFGIDGVSRAFLAQITRHRIASYSVQSQRYVKLDNFTFVTPPEIENNKEASVIFKKSMDDALKSYNSLADILTKNYYEVYIKNGDNEKDAEKKAEKKAIEDARFVLPNACDTQMIVTMNARSLLNFFKHRCCNRAQWEIKAVADEMLKLVCEVAPLLFANAGPDCYHSKCSEGKMSCGKQEEMKLFYSKIHNK